MSIRAERWLLVEEEAAATTTTTEQLNRRQHQQHPVGALLVLPAAVGAFETCSALAAAARQETLR